VALHEQLESPAAKQMAIQHHLGNSVGGKVYGAPGFRDRFTQTMNSMGFPQSSCMRKVALNNGSKMGVFQNFDKCAQSMRVRGELKPLAYPITRWALLPGLFWLTKKVCDYPIMEAIAYTAPAYDEACFAAKLILAGHYDNGYVIAGNGQPSMDLLPGAYQNLFLKVTQKAAKEKWLYRTIPEINFTNVSFIPSVSSFALKDLNRNWGDALNNINVQTDTPFDAIYAPSSNEEHTQLTKPGVDFVRAQLALADQGCTPVSYLPLANGCYTIAAKHSGKLMQPENSNNGARIRQFGANGQTNQIFQLESVSSDAYRITSKSTNKVWELQGGSTGSGTPVLQSDWTGVFHQQWALRAAADGTYSIGINSKFGVGQADVEGISREDGAGLHLWSETNGENQRFYFTSTGCAGTTSCDLNVSAAASNSNPAAGQPLKLTYGCSGSNCGGVSYSWSGNGISGNSSSLDIMAPPSPGTYTYTVTATGCTTKTASVSITVGSAGNSVSCSGVTFTDGQVIGSAGSSRAVVRIISGCPMLYWEGGEVVGGRTNYDWLTLLSGKTISDAILTSCLKWDGQSCGTTSCDFNVSAGASNSNPAAGQPLKLTYGCSGSNCGGVTYSWSGNGISGSSSPLDITTPPSAGTYTYTVTATGCTTKTASVSITVGSAGNGVTCSGVTFTEGQVIGTVGSSRAVIRIISGCPMVYWEGGSGGLRTNYDWLALLSGKTISDAILTSCLKWDGQNCGTTSCDFNVSAAASNSNPAAASL
jgi:hypothetical protein